MGEIVKGKSCKKQNRKYIVFKKFSYRGLLTKISSVSDRRERNGEIWEFQV
jgi:hypothetical protein